MMFTGLLALIASIAISTSSASSVVTSTISASTSTSSVATSTISASTSVSETPALSTSISATQSSANPAVSISATASSNATATVAACTQVLENPTCEKATCCLGSAGAWTGVKTAATIAYTDTLCVNNTATVTNSTKTCGQLCVSKECDGAVGLAVRATTIAMSFFVYWLLALQH